MRGPIELDPRDLSGRPAPLDAEPRPLRLALARGASRAALTLAPAERTDATGGRRERAVLVSDLAGDPDPDLLAPLLYLAVQRTRLWRRPLVLAPEPSLAAILAGAPGPAQEPTDRAAHRLWRACSPDDQRSLAAGFVDEAVAALDRHARAFADNAWCRAAAAGRLTREQYVAALADTHQYVRDTPRLLALAISITRDEDLGDHLTRHFRGEQKHDRLLESDLRYLGADLDYVLRGRVPALATLTFMAVQESALAWGRDPVGFLAAPFVAEGIVARVDPGIFRDLAANIRRWGYGEPARALRFLTSHVREDGGDDGHWARTVRVLAAHLRDDLVQRRFLAALHLAADAFTRSYESHACDVDLSL